MSPKKDVDLDKIACVLLDFFEDKRVVEALEKIGKCDVSGWEKWWQIELALFLSHASNIAEWDMECTFYTDKRTKLAQSRMALDIGFRLKNYSKDLWYFVELKQADNYRVCIDRMCKDAVKVLSSRAISCEGISIRYIACAGVFKDVSEEAVAHYVKEALSHTNIPYDGYCFKPLGNGYSLLVF